MKCKEIISAMNKIAPEDSALEWDNVGLLVGQTDSQINKILIALDLTDKVIEQAIKLNAGMIITHHPIFFGGVKRISQTAESMRVMKLIKHDICHYAAHTNLDISPFGTNSALFNLLELENEEGLEDLGSGQMGRIGKVKKQVSLKDLAIVIKNKLELKKINFYGQANAKIKKVALCTGAAASLKYFMLAKKNNCDVYLTGDIKYHDALLALDLNLNLVDITHYASEKIFAPKLKTQLQKYLCDIEIICADSSHDLFHVI